MRDKALKSGCEARKEHWKKNREYSFQITRPHTQKYPYLVTDKKKRKRLKSNMT